MIAANVNIAPGSDAGSIVVLVFAGIVVLALVIRLAAGSMDDGRIHEHVEGQGGQIPQS
jgi:hypothetical protein